MAFKLVCVILVVLISSIESRWNGLSPSVVELSSKKQQERSKGDGEGSHFWPPWPFSALSSEYSGDTVEEGGVTVVKSASPGLILMNAMRS